MIGKYGLFRGLDGQALDLEKFPELSSVPVDPILGITGKPSIISCKDRLDHIVKEKVRTQKCKMLVVDLEPAPYKVDLWNAFVDSDSFDMYVLYTTAKNWAPDSGHNFQQLPPARFLSTTFRGQGAKSILVATFTFLSLLFRWHPNFVFISGYVHPLPLLSIIACILLRKKYAVHSDIFNNSPPYNPIDQVKQSVRNLIRKLIFRTCTAVLVCGILGRESAIIAGCSKRKIYDFPYAVDRQRLCSDEPTHVPDVCGKDVASGKVIILFSGRLIERKGLGTLIDAIAPLEAMNNWSLWVEGDGPLFEQYVHAVSALGLEDRCRILGFCQMSLHSWLLRNSDIVVVPSLRDSWGIVVDEGMQMGKAVVTSDRTGSGADRILHDTNGLVFKAGNHLELSDLVRTLLINPEKRIALGNSARLTSAMFGPKTNTRTIIGLLQLE